MFGYIYKTTNLINNKVYIGKKQSDEFLGNNYLGSGVNLRKAIKKYGSEYFTVEMLECCDNLEELNKREKYWIDKMDSSNPKSGYNIAPGGDGGNTLQFRSEEDNEKRSLKLSEKMKGHKHSSETKNKIREKANLRYSNPEYRAKRKEINIKRYADHNDLRSKVSEGVKKSYEANPEKRVNLIRRQKKLWLDEEYREKQKIAREKNSYKELMHSKHTTIGRIRINNGLEEKTIFPENLDAYIKQGWKKGRLPFSEKTIQNMKDSFKNRKIKK